MPNLQHFKSLGASDIATIKPRPTPVLGHHIRGECGAVKRRGAAISVVHSRQRPSRTVFIRYKNETNTGVVGIITAGVKVAPSVNNRWVFDPQNFNRFRVIGVLFPRYGVRIQINVVDTKAKLWVAVRYASAGARLVAVLTKSQNGPKAKEDRDGSEQFPIHRDATWGTETSGPRSEAAVVSEDPNR